jgi:xanthine phosphoribosyltransferase
MLRDRILKEGRVLPNNIIDVSSFMETTLDMDLMEECAAELAARFEELRPTKILTVGTTGLALAAPMALRLSMPVIYARKSRTMVMTDYLSASYVSRTAQGVKRELVLGRSHIDPDDRVLIVDNFLSSGGIQDAMLRIILEAGAQPVGVAVLMEKAYESGRLYLSGYNIPIESLAKVVSVEEERIVLEGENEEPTQADKMHSEAEWAGGSSPSSSSS